MKRLVQLDSLRGLAALMVVLFHYTTRFQQLFGHPNQLPIEFPYGYYGVQLFFMISGFVIFMSVETTKCVADFLISRFSRLFPAYWVAVILTYSIVSTFLLPGREVTIATAILNLSMLQEWLGRPHVDGVYWTLTLELSFYVIMLSIFYYNLLNRIEIISVFWLVCMLAVYGIEGQAGVHFPYMFKTLFLLEYANLFIAGIMFYRWYYYRNMPVTYAILLTSLAVQLVIHGWISAFVCSLFSVFFYFAVINKGFLSKVLAFKPLVFLGGISYSLYLLHQNIGYVLIRVLYEHNFSSITTLSIAILTSIFLAFALNRLVEKPAMRLIRDYWNSRENPRSAA